MPSRILLQPGVQPVGLSPAQQEAHRVRQQRTTEEQPPRMAPGERQSIIQGTMTLGAAAEQPSGAAVADREIAQQPVRCWRRRSRRTVCCWHRGAHEPWPPLTYDQIMDAENILRIKGTMEPGAGAGGVASTGQIPTAPISPGNVSAVGHVPSGLATAQETGHILRDRTTTLGQPWRSA